MKDSHLALFVCALVMVDVAILLVYTLVEGLMESLEPKRTVNAENPSEIKGVSKMHAQCVVARYNFCEDIIIYERIPCDFVYELLVH